jgi:hypothetical protein
VKNNFSYCDFSKFEFKFELKFKESKVLLKHSRIKLKYLVFLEK